MNDGYVELLRLCERIGSENEARIAFSGGVDSSLVAAAMQEATGGRVQAVTVASAFVSTSALSRAERVAAHIGVTHRILSLDVFSVPGLEANPAQRCYLCKAAVFRLMGSGPPIFDGTNADDDPARPGRRAAAEHGVRSPLDELGLGKQAVRRMARALGLPNADDPSDSCLATRIPTGTRLTPERLRTVAEVEQMLHSRGVQNARARWKPDRMDIELPGHMLPLDPDLESAIIRKVRSLGFAGADVGARP